MQDYQPKNNNLVRDLSIIFLTAIVMFAVFFAYVQEVLSVPNNVIIQTSVMEVDNSNPEYQSLADVVEDVTDSVVEINTTYDAGTGAGSGVIIGKNDENTHSYIITNHHVIEDALTIKVILTNGDEFTASLVGSDPMGDIAVIQIETVDVIVATMGDSSQLRVGDTAIVIGNPLGLLGGTVTSGIVSSLDREVEVEGRTMRLLQTNAEINSGNSGGGLFNDQGLLMGIVNAKSFGTGVEGIGFAIPINTAKDIAVELIETSTSTSYGFVTGRVSLGITYLEINQDNYMDYPNGINRMGVWVQSFDDVSDAQTAGVVVNDQIYSINGTTITTVLGVNTILEDCEVGDVLFVVVERSGVVLPFYYSVTLTQYVYIP